MQNSTWLSSLAIKLVGTSPLQALVFEVQKIALRKNKIMDRVVFYIIQPFSDHCKLTSSYKLNIIKPQSF